MTPELMKKWHDSLMILLKIQYTWTSKSYIASFVQQNEITPDDYEEIVGEPYEKPATITPR